MSPPSSSLPLYIQIAERLIRDIAAGRLIDGARLPPERDLAAQMNTTVTTLRKSLDVLVDKGLLQRVQGSGNYIKHNKSVRSLYSMFRLELPSGGGLPTAQVQSVSRVAKPADHPLISDSLEVTCIKRHRYLDDQFIALEEIWLDGRAGHLGPQDVSDSLYHTYSTQLGLWITRAEDRVRLARRPDMAPAAFAPEHRDLLGYIERLSWAQDDTPIEFSRTWFDPMRAVYIQRLS
jgi:GntR family transcriptional regulator